jgi:hypothetical protein
MPMIMRSWVAVLAVACLAPAAAPAAELNVHLRPLKGLVGKTWRGTLSKPGAAKVQVDVQRWEEALNGQAVRILHSVNDGEYGGESLVVWDKQKQSLVFTYFTTADFYTAGAATVEGDALVTLEEVKGDAEGITQVKGITRLTPDGKMRVKTQYLKKGAWADGRDVDYEEAKDALVKFR